MRYRDSADPTSYLLPLIHSRFNQLDGDTAARHDQPQRIRGDVEQQATRHHALELAAQFLAVPADLPGQPVELDHTVLPLGSPFVLQG